MEFIRIQGTYIRSDQIIELSVQQTHSQSSPTQHILMIRVLGDEHARWFTYDTRAKAMAAINCALKQLELSKDM